ncbi:hypothetical protein Hdeb2414_s0001g00027051 [Helianthus debilis subsp. tardiflorus]
MAVSSTFKERLQQMEDSRNQRLSLLQELEKDKDKYFALKVGDIDEFRVQAEIFATECKRRVEELC